MLAIEIAVLIIIILGLSAVTMQRLGVLQFYTCLTSLVLCIITLLILNSQGSNFIFGNFNRFIGIEHHIDTASLLIAPMVCLCGTYTLLFTMFYTPYSVRTKYTIGFLSLAASSSLIIIITRDIFNFYIFFELLNICICLIFANTHIKFNKKNTLEYLLIGGVAAIFLVFAIEIIYIIFDSLNIVVILHDTKTLNSNEAILLKIATTFIVLASFLKLGIFPFTSWVRKIYKTCPNELLTFYGSIINTISIYLVVFFLYKVLHSYDCIQFASRIINPFCIAGIIIFSIASIQEKDLRVIMGYSTLAQIAYIYICFATPNIHTLTGGFLHLIHNILVKFGMFAIVSSAYLNSKTYHIRSFAGLGKNIPVGIAFCVFAASLVGIPGTSGFISKFYMIKGLVEEGSFITVCVFIFGSILNIIYMWNIVSYMYFQEGKNSNHTVSKFPQIVICTLAAIVIVFGFSTNFILAKSRNIATQFLQNI